VDAAIFDIAAERLESHSGLPRLEARGTLRIALKLAGLAANSVTAGQLSVVFDKVMPGELEKRGVSDAAAVCSAVVGDLVNTPVPAEAKSGDDLDAIFRRLANG
jgi:hypothetical protein